VSCDCGARNAATDIFCKIRFLSYDAIAGRIVLLEGKGRYAVPIDISAAVDDRFSEWVNDRLTTLIVIGYLESSVSGERLIHSESAP
jgi:hypothetical protein